MVCSPVYAFSITLLASTLAGLSGKDASKQIHFLSSNVDFNRHYMRDFRIDIHGDNDSLNVIYDVVKNFGQDHWVELIFSTKNRRTNKYRNLLQINANACEVFRKQGSNLFATFTQKFWKGKFPGCPLPKGNYTWFNLTAADLYLPPFFDGQYKAYIDLHFRKKSVRESISNMSLILELK